MSSDVLQKPKKVEIPKMLPRPIVRANTTKQLLKEIAARGKDKGK